MATAVNRLQEIDGGWVLVHRGEIVGEVRFEVGGLMTARTRRGVRYRDAGLLPRRRARSTWMYKPSALNLWKPGFPEFLKFATLTCSPWRWVLVAPSKLAPEGLRQRADRRNAQGRLVASASSCQSRNVVGPLRERSWICTIAPRRASGAKLGAPPRGRRGSDRSLELAAEVIDVTKSADLGDLGKRHHAVGDQRLGMGQPLSQQPLMRAGPQMLAEQPSEMGRADLRQCPTDRRCSRRGRGLPASQAWPRSRLRERDRAPRPSAPGRRWSGIRRPAG